MIFVFFQEFCVTIELKQELNFVNNIRKLKFFGIG